MIYYLIFFLGLLAGALIRRPRLFDVAHGVMVGCGYLLITLFGFQMASSFLCGDSQVADVASAGVLAVCAATGSVVFSFLFLWLTYNLICFNHKEHKEPKDQFRNTLFFNLILSLFSAVSAIFAVKNSPLRLCDSAGKSFSNSQGCSLPTATANCHPAAPGGRLISARYLPVTISLSLLLVGIVVGVVVPAVPVEVPIKIFLLLMILAVGVQSTRELRTLSTDHSSSRGVALFVLLALPVAVMMGTLCFCAGAGLFLKYGWRDSMLCGAAMGWQTLGGPMVQELRGLQLGNVAFLTNMFRDVVSLLLIPLVSRRGFELLGVTPGGVSSMDMLLPGIMAASGRHVLLYAMWVGASCSFWAPILIYLIAKGMS
jgi:uncharacterized membrane protein YbjE (DUF340 family)